MKRNAWIVAVVLLSISLLTSIVLGLSGYYFSVAYLKSNCDLALGDKILISVSENESNVASFCFDGGYLPNERIEQTVQIVSKNLAENMYVRAKIVVFVENENTNFVPELSEHFVLCDDGYFYFDDVLRGGNKIAFCNALLFPSENTFLSDKKYVASIVVETLSEGLNVSEIWKTSVFQ